MLGGRVHVDAAYFSNDQEIRDTFGRPDSGADMRRAFLEFGGVYKQLEFNFWMNFAKALDSDNDEDFSDSIDFRNVFLGLIDVPVIGNIRAGYFKETLRPRGDHVQQRHHVHGALVDRRVH